MAVAVSGVDLVSHKQSLRPACVERVVNPLVFSNLDCKLSPVFTDLVLREFVPRDFLHDEVIFGRYPPDALLDAQQGYLLVCGGVAVKEQIAPWAQEAGDAVLEAQREMGAAEFVGIPTFLAARYGETTWGHWLLELLPKIALVEKTFPRLFAFAIPSHIIEVRRNRSYADSVVESLKVYGIGADRLFPIGSSRIYRFSALFDIFGMHRGCVPNPLALDTLREPFRHAAKSHDASCHIAILRGYDERRSIFNRGEIVEVLQRFRFKVVDLSSMTFLEQVNAVGSASMIVGELGSGLANLVYASKGTKIITLAPLDWTDAYFAPLLAILEAVVADVRGVSTRVKLSALKHDPTPANSSYLIPPIDMECAVQFLIELKPLQRDCWTNISGKTRPRAVGIEIARIEFGYNHVRPKLATVGFLPEEANLQWTEGTAAEIQTSCLSGCPGDVWMRVQGIGFIAEPMYMFKPVEVFVMNRKIGEFNLHNICDEFFLLPYRFIMNVDSLIISFRHPCCPSPQSIGVSDDRRNLGIGLTLISFHDAQNAQEIFPEP